MFAPMPPSPPSLAEFQSTVTGHSGRWYAACLRITRDAGLAEDAVQEALINAWSKRATFAGRNDLDVWIHSIAVNAALQILRRQRNAPWSSDQTSDTPDPHTPIDSRDAQEIGAGLGAALDQLSELERTCFVLKHVEQWRLDDIAVSLQTGVNNIKQALFRAVRKLRVSMAPWRSEP
jgi:RNA polymerase sigma-70 factor (ECF subfamily)